MLRRAMARADFFFFDLSLSLLPDDSSNSNSNSNAVAPALDLGYSAVALDHPHRGLLPDSHSTPIASSPLSCCPPPPSLPTLHASHSLPRLRRRLRLRPRPLRRPPCPLTQAAFDHLCQAAFDQLDIISIDFSHKLPFRFKLPILKLALHRGLHFEIAYSPLIADATSRRQAIAEAKTAAVPSIDLKAIEKHVEFLHDAMELDG
ncbi:hypothetical protein E2562_030166 [Oryza meyeriana var. granulata]|uniref:Uncharacterized protein n=1 Tax=Oryza meyeriana var. granulata TaxID=110450 RepID=A0A6G1BNY4_9ORYZ|nr:hypothetical protein E2562_030166 [Oryza meyeriana var. granulata]